MPEEFLPEGSSSIESSEEVSNDLEIEEAVSDLPLEDRVAARKALVKMKAISEEFDGSSSSGDRNLLLGLCDFTVESDSEHGPDSV